MLKSKITQLPMEAQASSQPATNGFLHPTSSTAEPIPTTPSSQPPIAHSPVQPIGSQLLSSIAQQQPQYPPGVKVPAPSDQSPAMSGNLSQFPQSIRPPSAGPHQLMPLAQQPRTPAPISFPGSLSDLVVSFETVKQKGVLSLIICYFGFSAYSVFISSPSHV